MTESADASSCRSCLSDGRTDGDVEQGRTGQQKTNKSSVQTDVSSVTDTVSQTTVVNQSYETAAVLARSALDVRNLLTAVSQPPVGRNELWKRIN